MNLFGRAKPKETPKEQVRRWTSSLKHEMRQLDRDARKIEREEAKVKKELQKEAKLHPNSQAIKTLAKGLVRSRKARENLMESKARLNSVCLQMNQVLSTVKVVGQMQKSAQVMKAMNQLMSVSKVRHVAMEMSKEMTKAGLMEEIMEDSFEMMDDEDLDEIADQEVDAVLFEITAGKLGEAPNVKVKGNAAASKLEKQESAVALDEQEEEEDDDKELAALRARVNNLSA
eukprot:TRINITY_DN66392_c9_g1_i11.p1 TRINITY_DN66392_c9_g1~~TRINITY_DN66392_c9_g1_i11.p1  ORF type:complete len:230 (-),score=141.34 TRINITY_DN66392_c9_g1_i11:88-777(-)